MTPADLRAIRKSLAMTQDALASALGVSRRAVQSWEMGECAIPEPVARIMRLAAVDHWLMERMAALSP